MSRFVFTAIVIGLIFSVSVNTEQINNFRMCSNTKCEVFDMFIDPCPETLRGKPCEISKGINATLTFKYITRFSSEKPKTRLYAETPMMDLPFLDMNPNACLYTECPIYYSVEQDWNYTLYVHNYYPTGSYTVKFKLWDDGPNGLCDEECCFKFDMAII